jgi:hypothetical protein
MTGEKTPPPPLPAASRHSGRLLYPLAALLVLIYVNTFELWAFLVRTIGAERAAYVPFAALAFAVAVASMGGWIVLRRKSAERDTLRIRPVLLVLGLGLAVVGLALTDPAYPAKRIHVPQYLLLALVLRRALSDHVGGAVLTATTILVTLIFGIHDEMLQGLHPSRSYGLRDMAVNGTAGAAGALMAAGAGPWHGPPGPASVPIRIGAVVTLQLTSLAFLVLSLMTYVWTGPAGQPPPALTGVPAAVASLVLMALVRSGQLAPGTRHVCTVIAWITLPFALYPVIPHVTPLVFH